MDKSANELAAQCRDAMWAKDKASQDLGMQIKVLGPGHAVASLEVQSNMVNGHNICHGGYLFTLADSAFAFACNTYNRITVAAGASIEFILPARLGDRLEAAAKEIQRGGRSGLYDVIITNHEGSVIAVFRGRSHMTSEPLLSM